MLEGFTARIRAPKSRLLLTAVLLSACGPAITSIEPPAAPVGAVVVIHGSGFGDSQGAGGVRFAGIDAGSAVSWSDSTIAVAVPAGAVTGAVTVQAGQLISSASRFIVSGPRVDRLRIGTYPVFILPGSPAASLDDEEVAAAATSPTSQQAVVATDLNEDGNPDFAFGAGNRVYWHWGDGSGRFSTGSSVGLGSIPGVAGLGAGDVNRDGHVDLVASAYKKLAVLLGDGTGGFLPPVFSVSTDGLYGLVVEDFNNDQNPDVAASSPGGVQVFWGDGQGGVSAPLLVALGVAGQAVGAADFNGDGYADIVVATSPPLTGGPGSLFVLLNDRHGGFSVRLPVGTDSAPAGIALDDFDRDGDVDVALVHDQYFSAVNNLAIYSNDGTGALIRTLDVPRNDYMKGLNGADLNGDGITDLIAGGAERIYTFLGFGDGTFLPWGESYRDYSQGIAVADFNVDGRADVYSNGIYGGPVILGDGSGGLASATFLQLIYSYDGLTGFDTGDFDEDGRVDLAIDVATFDPGYSLVTLLNDGAGGFGETWTPVSQGPTLQHVSRGDFNGDGHDDVVRVGLIGPSYYLEAILGDGHGGFSGPFRTSLNTPSGTADVVAGDLNGDGKDDVVVGFGPDIEIWFSNGNGTFGSMQVLEAVQADWGTVSIAHVNDDSAKDIVFKTESFFDDDGDIRVYLGDGSGGFGLSDLIASHGGQMLVADVDGDGTVDLVDADDAQQHPVAYRVWFGLGDGTFIGPVSSPYIGIPSGSGDFNEDGWCDVVAESAAGIIVAFGDGSGHFEPSVDRYANDPSGSSLVADVNGDNHLDVVEITYWGHIAFYLGDGQGNFVDYD